VHLRDKVTTNLYIKATGQTILTTGREAHNKGAAWVTGPGAPAPHPIHYLQIFLGLSSNQTTREAMKAACICVYSRMPLVLCFRIEIAPINSLLLARYGINLIINAAPICLFYDNAT
jgi:hypothetical protein